MHVLNASLGQLPPKVTVNTSDTVITFTDLGAQMPDCVITNLGSFAIVVSTVVIAALPTVVPLDQACLVGPGVVATFRKGFGVSTLHAWADGGASIAWFNAMNGS